MKLSSSITHWANRLGSLASNWSSNFTNNTNSNQSGFAGLAESAKKMEEGTEALTISSAVGSSWNSPNNVGVKLDLSPQARAHVARIQTATNLTPEQALVQINEAGITYSASAKLIRSNQQNWQNLLHSIAG